MFRLDNKVAIVTGAARGVGAATARALARQGAMVAAADLRVDEVQKLAEEFDGRVKAGAVKFADNAEQAERAISGLISLDWRVYKVTLSRLSHKLYAGITWDTSAKLQEAIIGFIGGAAVEASSADSEAMHLLKLECFPAVMLCHTPGGDLYARVLGNHSEHPRDS